MLAGLVAWGQDAEFDTVPPLLLLFFFLPCPQAEEVGAGGACP